MTSPNPQPLLAAIRALYRRDIEAGGPAAPMLAEVEAALAGIDAAERQPGIRDLPCSTHLDAVAEAAADTLMESIARAAQALAPHCWWQQNPNYHAGNVGQRFMDHYGYVNLVGWHGFAERDHIACGFMVIGPDLTYPPHAHPAEEVYHPFVDGSEWQRDDEPWRPEPAGACIHHPSWVRHATRTGKRPLVALFAWRGELGADRAKFV